MTGLPDPKAEHALTMFLFALTFLVKLNKRMRKLEAMLVIGTDHLAILVGLQSGVVTTWVMHCLKSRFELFGVTMNTTLQMENMGPKNAIQILKLMADLLIVAGKTHWLTKQDGLVKAKWQVDMETYWV